LTLVGAGPQDQELRGLAAALGLRNVTFAGRVAPEAIAHFYSDHDIYLQSPDIDNMPTSILEAFASGLPVVSTAAGGVPSLVTSGEDGLLTPLNDHTALAAHVLRLLEDPAAARRMVLAAYASCRSCTWPVVREQWLAVYRSLLPASGV